MFLGLKSGSSSRLRFLADDADGAYVLEVVAGRSRFLPLPLARAVVVVDRVAGGCRVGETTTRGSSLVPKEFS
jgi:hypothetical protein